MLAMPHIYLGFTSNCFYWLNSVDRDRVRTLFRNDTGPQNKIFLKEYKIAKVWKWYKLKYFFSSDFTEIKFNKKNYKKTILNYFYKFPLILAQPNVIYF